MVDLRLFKVRNFTVGALTLAVAYGVFFGNVVLLPLWLQSNMGYTPPTRAWSPRRWGCWPSC